MRSSVSAHCCPVHLDVRQGVPRRPFQNGSDYLSLNPLGGRGRGGFSKRYTYSDAVNGTPGNAWYSWEPNVLCVWISDHVVLRRPRPNQPAARRNKRNTPTHHLVNQAKSQKHVNHFASFSEFFGAALVRTSPFPLPPPPQAGP